ncbi:ATP-binding protein [Desulfosporosinus sp. BG]|uniref:ATP-binding protein n=1 Tax=Desulfosporosinus sp. BG TaxID=1633135 RepID=UPI001A9A63CD|nr:ATP-binding protein [Desulfosporosinus sp. BG]
MGNSKFLDIIPGGFSIATDVSCETIVHNPITAKFLRIEPWEQFSYSSQKQPTAKIYHKGKPIAAEDQPIQRAAWYGEEITRCELEFIWEDGVSKIAQWSASPLRDDTGNICGAIATMEDITEIIYMARELDMHKSQLEELVEKTTEAWKLQFEKLQKAEREAWQSETEIKLIKRALKSAEDRFAKAFYLSPQQKSIIRLSDRRYIDVNESFTKARNQARHEVIGKTPCELGSPTEEAEKVFYCLEKQGSIDNLEISIPKHNGTFGKALLSAEVVEIDGELCGLFDYTEITELKKMQAEMARLDRLNLVGQMAAGIAHEIRNPMTTVRGYLQFLGAKQEYITQRSTFDLMISELDRANSIITEFLSLTRNQPTRLKCQNLNDILNNLYPMIEADAFNQNKLIKFIPQEIPDIQLSTKEIHQLVLNLCHNGLEAMREQSRLTIRTFTDSEGVVLSVQDEGAGIGKEAVGKLGTPFYTTKEGGTGLGLAMCYNIAESHNASIDVDTGPQGTTFFVRFNPVKQETLENVIVVNKTI